MTDPTPHRRIPPTSLEPWALDLLEREGAAPDPKAREELARVVSLLRNLGEPEPDPERIERMLDALAAQHSRPTVLRVAFGLARSVARPSVAFALAAGVAGLLAITVAPEGLPLLGPDGPDGRLEESPVIAAAPTPTTPPEPVRRRSTPVIRPQLVNAGAFSASSAIVPHLGYDRAPIEYAYDRSLDRQLNQLLIDPDSFARRLERVAQRDRFIARLAERAAERGDAPEIALRVRQSRHPIAAQLVDRLLRATLVASVSQR